MIDIDLFNTQFSETVQMPETWNDFTVQELELLSRTLNNNGSAVEYVLSVLQGRIAMKGLKMPSGMIYKLNPEDVGGELMDMAELWLKQNNLTKNPYPELQGYIGPADDFNNLTCGEFEAAEVAYLLASSEKSQKNLAELAAILWRPKQKNGKRQPYEPNDEIPSFFHNIDPVILQVIWLWYMGCRDNLSNIFPRLFPKSGNNKNENPDLTAVTKMIHSGAGERNGSRKEIRAMLLKEFLFDVQLQMQDYEDMKAKMKKNS